MSYQEHDTFSLLTTGVGAAGGGQPDNRPPDGGHRVRGRGSPILASGVSARLRLIQRRSAGIGRDRSGLALSWGDFGNMVGRGYWGSRQE